MKTSGKKTDAAHPRECDNAATEKKRLEESLKETNAKFLSLINAIPDAIFFKDTHGRYVMVNKSFEKGAGADKEAFIGKSDADFMTAELAERCRMSDEHLMKTGRPLHTIEDMITGEDGEKRYFDSMKAPIHDSQGNLLGLVGVSRDVTERKEAEESLLLFRNLLNQSNDAIFVNDPATGGFLIVNDKACGNLGYTRNELLSLRTIDIEAIFPDQSTWDAHVNALKRKGSMILEGTQKRSDGTPLPVEVNVAYMTSGEKDYMVAVARDITERKLSEQALRTSEERLSRAQKMAHVGNWEWNIVTNELYWSEEVYHIYGVDPATFVPGFDAVGKAMHPDDLEPFIKAVNAALYDGKPFEMDYRLIRPDGTERTVHTIGEVSFDTSGKPLVKSGTVQDITERKKMEEALRSSRDFIENILNTVDEAFIVIDREFRIVRANSAYGMQVGVPVPEIAGKHCYEISHQLSRPCDESGEECAVRRCFATGKPHSCVHKHISRDGHTLYVETKSFPLKDASGAIVSAIEVINNITDKHLLEEQMLRTQKLEAVGLLAGGIAHDFNNLLQGVFGSISMAKMSSDREGKAYSMLEQAETALYQATNLTKQLLTFSKGGEPVKKVVALPAVIDNAVRFALSGSNISYQPSADENLWPVQADEGQINQVVHNIVLNASEAMADGGTVRITMKNILIPETSDLPLEKGKYVRIDIRDSGMGIPDGFLAKIFDPYFTTKKKGSGLGLATSYSIIKRHGGVIMVNSQLGAGTTFSLYLPASEDGSVIEQSPERSLLSGKGRILIMDDEDIVRMVAGHMLKGLGYEAVFAENGEQALEKFSAAVKAGKPFDAVVLDLTIRGGMGGKETVKKLAEIDPSVRAIVSSGYSADDILAHYEDHGFLAVLTKPYQIEELSRVLHEALDKEN